MNNQGGDLLQDAARLLEAFAFTTAQTRELSQAFEASSDGFERCALRAKAIGQREGRSGAGLLLTMIRAGEHLLEAKPNTPLPTGWRWVRGIDGQSGTFVEDPQGTDRLPPGYDFTPSPRYESPLENSDELPALTDEVKAELRKLGVRA